ncbi:hypothetical protein CBR_g32344 [Chara braunii]|uniref:Uncharacterized protein n=1 Tax=Chara braunii TaxID=69332 RepID=A0A388JNQ0_CHABU|nr:hypothetical protein CBR_g32344 [Chara braunii]|eukprot:GBG59332.1 hypothetical protein CBR_g32344 [Chara braunii]
MLYAFLDQADSMTYLQLLHTCQSALITPADSMSAHCVVWFYVGLDASLWRSSSCEAPLIASSKLFK